jgi:hypothetical protein
MATFGNITGGLEAFADHFACAFGSSVQLVVYPGVTVRLVFDAESENPLNSNNKGGGPY